MKKQKPVFSGQKVCNFAKENITCRHDYKNAIQVGNVDYVCPLCKELLDPLEWFFMNSFKFVEVRCEEPKKQQFSRKTMGRQGNI